MGVGLAAMGVISGCGQVYWVWVMLFFLHSLTLAVRFLQVIMITADNQKIYVSNDGGSIWTKRKLPASVGSSKDILMSEVNPNHIALTAGNGEVSVDIIIVTVNKYYNIIIVVCVI